MRLFPINLSFRRIEGPLHIWVTATLYVCILGVSDGKTAITTIARENTSAPGGGQFSQLFDPVLNSSGQIAFRAGLQSANPPGSGIYLYNGSNLVSIARENTSAPGGGQFSQLFDPVLNSSGQIAFRAGLQSANPPGSGIYLTDGIDTGDFNGDNKIDASDYVVWRKNGGTQEEFSAWRANFGETIGEGTFANTNVPEPASVLTLLIGGVAIFRRRITQPIKK
jgi:hypothetical protein